MARPYIDKGILTKLSEQDLDIVVGKNIYYEKSGYAMYTVCTTKDGVKNRKNYRIHRVVLERMTGQPIPKGHLVDHINGDRLDNRRDNLRLVNRTQNSQNRTNTGWGKSKISGILWSNTENRWIVKLNIDKKQRTFGRFTDLREAEKVCKKVKMIHFGEYARGN